MSSQNVIVRILHGYRGVRTNNVYMKPGKHGVDPEFAQYLVENGHAEYVDEPTTEAQPEPTQDETPKRKISKRKKTDKAE